MSKVGEESAIASSISRPIAILLCVAVLASAQASAVLAKEEHFLDYSEDNFKVVFISGNLTAAVTHDWPRVIFEHSTDPFSPTFEVGLPRMFLFNDSNSDGFFSISEITYVSYLDNNHVQWNVTPVEFVNDSIAGESAMFRMNTTLALYEGLSNGTIAVRDWANVTFWFKITQRGYYETNELGSFLVRGKSDLAFNYTLEILKSVNTTGIVVEHLMQGGGSSNMFMVRQMGRYHSIVDDFVSSRIDQTTFGTNFTNGISPTDLPDQQISFAKEDRTIQANYRWDSQPEIDLSGNSTEPSLAYSYYTTGTGLMLHAAYIVGNATGTIHQRGLVGLDDSAFVGKISNWLKKNIVGVVLFTGAMAALIVVSALVLGRVRRKQSRMKAQADDKKT